MEKEGRNHYHTRGASRSGSAGNAAERDLLLQWGNRKRLRCVKVQRRDVEAAATAAAEKAAIGQRRAAAAAAAAAAQHHPTGHTHHRVLRHSEEFSTMKSPAQQQQNNGIHTVASPDRERPGRGNINNNGVPQTFPDDKKGSSSGSEGSIWPKFAIALSNREKEEDFLVFKGSKLPQRPKKRAKVIQRTVNFVCPGTWLCELTLERYEVREKKVSKKRPRGLKAMHDMDSDSE
ncbi:hypothetical protein HU200_019020 [Digitaria exilis]|uniref:DUF1639 family protein n=1 Tax=Digitaria exilis TaxID=1010633 RepID=A0A835F3U9_9POAL|nr:hypothetical protein HU200_019020 [Digitaria exilis]